MNWQPIKRLESADGLRRAEIQTSGHGEYRFTEHTHITEDGDTFWVPTWESGLYNSPEAAEREARAELPWLQPKLPN